jgi:3,4-dihydroxy-2-butanone 4-phosphate synthase
VTRRTPTESVQAAVAALAAGGMVVVVDDADREDEGDLVVAAELVTTEQMAFLVRHTTGIGCAPMSSARAEELRLPQVMRQLRRPRHGVHRHRRLRRDVHRDVSSGPRDHGARAGRRIHDTR